MSNLLNSVLKSAVAGAALWGFAGAASAGLVSFHVDGENDCAGFFTTGPGECEVNGSSLIAKFGAGDDLGENKLGSSYPSITGDEFEFSNSGTGEWSYDPGADDPGVRYWVAKGGNGFNLFFWSDTYTGENIDWFSLDEGTRNAWLDSAQTVTSGTFYTPLNGGGNRAGLSHISFYNGASVPEPATLGMLGAGLFALGLMRRRATAG